MIPKSKGTIPLKPSQVLLKLFSHCSGRRASRQDYVDQENMQCPYNGQNDPHHRSLICSCTYLSESEIV